MKHTGGEQHDAACPAWRVSVVFAIMLLFLGTGAFATGARAANAAAVPTTDADPAGLYAGTLSFTGAATSYPAFAIVLQDGTAAVFARTSFAAPASPLGFVFHDLAVKPRGDQFSTAFTVLTQPGNQVADLPSFAGARGTMEGTVDRGVSISGHFVTPGNTGTLTLKAVASDGSRAASGEAIAGTFEHVFPVKGVAISALETVKPDGTGLGSDDVTHCVVSQTYSIPDPARNAYAVVNDVTCGTRPPSRYLGLEVFFPQGTGAAFNGGVGFATDTILAITEDGRTGFMKIARKVQ